jgi:predicted  nucleic acid-binding Zn-ribbon protein
MLTTRDLNKIKGVVVESLEPLAHAVQKDFRAVKEELGELRGEFGAMKAELGEVRNGMQVKRLEERVAKLERRR